MSILIINNSNQDVKFYGPSFEEVCRPVIEWINNNANPHSIIQIDATSAVLYSGEKSITTEEFIKD